MAYEEKYVKPELPHSLKMDGRERLAVSGVTEVESFDDLSIVAVTTQGLLIIRGHQLHIDRLSLDVGELSVTGFVDSLQYEESQKEKGGFFSRLLR